MIDPAAFRDSRDSVVEMLEGEHRREPESLYEQESERGELYVHPGFSEYSGFLDNTWGLGQEDFQAYVDEVGSSMQDSLDSGDHVGVLYPDDFEEETRDFVDRFVDTEEVSFIPTYSKTGDGLAASSRPVTGSDENGFFSGESRYAGFINGIEDGGELEVYGELGNQCYENASWFAEEITEAVEKDIEVKQGRGFPEETVLPLPGRNISLNSRLVPDSLESRSGDMISSLFRPTGP
jgi:hypothetical protein